MEQRMERRQRMRGAERRQQVLAIAAEQFADSGLHGTSAEVIARRAGITQAYVFRMFGTKKALFLEVVTGAFDRVTDSMRDAGQGRSGLDAMVAMGRVYHELLADTDSLLLQLQGYAACGDDDVRDAVRGCFSRMWQAVSDATGLDPVTVKAFLAFGMLLNSNAALQADRVDEPWAHGVRTLIRPGLFEHITSETNT
jgi:AcrR family transcriptional regulator